MIDVVSTRPPYRVSGFALAVAAPGRARRRSRRPGPDSTRSPRAGGAPAAHVNRRGGEQSAPTAIAFGVKSAAPFKNAPAVAYPPRCRARSDTEFELGRDLLVDIGDRGSSVPRAAIGITVALGGGGERSLHASAVGLGRSVVHG